MNQTKSTTKKKKEKIASNHHLLHNTTTIEEGDDIVVITFFVAKPQKRHMSPFCYNKTIEEGDESCCLLLLCYNGTT
jgi:hypothetical protein